MTLLKKITDLIGIIWSKKTVAEVKPYSKFSYFLDGLESDDAMYDDVSSAVNLCDEALRIAKQRIVLIDRISAINVRLQELEAYSKLSDGDSDKLKKLVSGYSSLREERNQLRYQLTDFDRNLNRMTELESDAISAIPKIQDAEKYQRILKHDLGHLKGEKSDLEYERELIDSGLDFIGKFSIAMVVIFGFIAIYLGYSYMIGGSEIFYPTSVLVLMAILIVSILYVFRRKLSTELIMNIKKQNKAVDMINTKSVVYAYYTNFLNYEYKKYNVNNVQMLKMTLKEYGNYKHVASRIDNIRNILFETETEIEGFLRQKNLNQLRFSVDQFITTVNIDDKLEYYRGLLEKRRSMETNLGNLDERHGRIWDLLIEFSGRDITDEKIIDQIIQAYFDEVSRVLLTQRNESMGKYTEEDSIEESEALSIT